LSKNRDLASYSFNAPSLINRLRNIACTLIDSEKGEQMAQAYANAGCDNYRSRLPLNERLVAKKDV
jgi:hypothetical protein